MSKSQFQKKSSVLLSSIILASATSAFAGGTIKVGDDKSISVGMGLRTAFTSSEDTNNFSLQNARIYLSGQVNKDFKFTYNTEEIWGSYGVLDAIIQYEPSKAFNIWMGRHLTPADRIEMNGPFYGLSWNQYTMPLYSSDEDPKTRAGAYGRDNGITAWGTINKFQYAIGVFDGLQGGANIDDNLLFAGRFAYNFLSMEDNPAYYTSSTYYGGLGDIFTVAVSGQQQSDGAGIEGNSVDFMGAAIDFLYETKLGSGDVITVEGEYKVMDADLNATALASEDNFFMFDGASYFATAAYLLANPIGKGKFQPYVRFTSVEPTDENIGSSDLTEVGVNYVVASHSMRLNFNVTSGDASPSGAPGIDATSYTFGMQQQF